MTTLYRENHIKSIDYYKIIYTTILDPTASNTTEIFRGLIKNKYLCWLYNSTNKREREKYKRERDRRDNQDKNTGVNERG